MPPSGLRAVPLLSCRASVPPPVVGLLCTRAASVMPLPRKRLCHRCPPEVDEGASTGTLSASLIPNHITVHKAYNRMHDLQHTHTHTHTQVRAISVCVSVTVRTQLQDNERVVFLRSSRHIVFFFLLRRLHPSIHHPTSVPLWEGECALASPFLSQHTPTPTPTHTKK